MSKLDKWKSIAPVVFIAASILISASGCASNIKTSNSEQAKSNSVNAPNSSYVKFTRFAMSDTWQKNKLLWLPDIDKSYWQSLYDQNYFVITGNSQGSKISEAVGIKEFELISPGNYTPFDPSDSVMILSLYSNINSIKTDENNILVTIEPKSAGYDAVVIPRTEMSRLPHAISSDINNKGVMIYNFILTNSKGDILHKERVFLSP